MSPRIAPAPFRFRALDGRVLVTNDFGRFRWLSPADFRAFAAGRLVRTGREYEALCRDGFVRARLDLERLAATWRRRHAFLWRGPALHIVVVTLRCNHVCAYCHASAGRMTDAGLDMTEETARRVVDRILESPSPALTVEFQGGEPLANWPVVRRIVEYAEERNKDAGKTVRFSLVSNMTLMDEDKLDWLLARGVGLCTSIDGPADLHDANRTFLGGGSHAEAVKWWRRIRARTRRSGLRVDALATVTRRAFGRERELVEEYAGLGMRGIFLRPLDGFGLARRTRSAIGYEPDEFLEFYEKALDLVLEINRKRTFFEQGARLLLQKILTDDDPNFLDLRSPCGAGIGQLAYDYDGRVYPCDEGRLLRRMGDDAFRLGDAAQGRYEDFVGHPTVKAMSVASSLDGQPQCADCAYKPYCGVCPVQCRAEQGDLMGRMPANARCRLYKGTLDLLFRRLRDPAARRIFESWVFGP